MQSISLAYTSPPKMSLFVFQFVLIQIQNHLRAPADFRLRVYSDSQILANPFAEIQPDSAGVSARAAVVAGISLLKNSRQILRGDSDSRVFNPESKSLCRPLSCISRHWK